MQPNSTGRESLVTASVALVVTANCMSCEEAGRLWQGVCDEHGLELARISADDDAGQALVQRLGIEWLPVLLIDGVPSVVGVPSTEVAHRVLTSACNPESPSTA